MKKLSCALLVFALAGCGGWDQDPTKGKDGRFNGGIPLPTKPIGVEPIPAGLINITAPYYQSFEELKTRRFEILVRILEEGYEVDMQIDNLDAFPGATYDKATGVFSWMPPKGFVEGRGAGISTDMELKMKVYAAKAGSIVFTGDHKVEFKIFRAYAEPTITRIDLPRSSVREGEVMDITVYYTDKDASSDDKASWSQLLFSPVAGKKSIAGIVTFMGTVKLSNPFEYRSRIRLDLSEGEYSNAIDTYAVGLSMVSRFGKQSPLQPVNIDVMTSFAAPVTTWTERVSATIEETTTYKFVIADPKQEQELSIEGFADLPDGATASCVRSGISVLNCELVFTPVAGTEGEHVIRASVKGMNTDKRDGLVSMKTLYLRTLVLPKGN